MSQPIKMKPASPRIKHGTPDTSFAASPFAKSIGTPSSPFRASLNAFPALPEEGEYAGFDESWNPVSPMNGHAGPSGTAPGHGRTYSASSRFRAPSISSRQESTNGVEDLEDFFERGTFNDLDTDTSATFNRSRKVSQGASTTAMSPPQNTSRSAQSAGLGRPPPQRQRSASLSQFEPSENTSAITPSTDFAQTPEMVFATLRRQFQHSPATTTTTATDSAVISPDLSESMLRPLPGTRTLSGWRAPVAPIDYSARLRTYSESVASQRRELNELDAQFRREKAEIRANPPVAPYAVRKALFNNEEAARRLAKEKDVKEKRIQIQRAEAEAAAAIAEKRRIGDAEFHKAKAAQQAAVDAAIKVENERRNRLEADKKAGDEKKKVAKELHEAKIQAVMQAAAAGSPSLSQEDRQIIAAYYMHLQNGGPQIPAYEELLKRFYASGGSPAGLIQFMEDMHLQESARAELAELQKLKARQDEQLAAMQAARMAEQAQAQAAAQAAAAGTPVQRLYNTPPRSPFGGSGAGPRLSPRSPNMSANGSASPGSNSPFSMAALVDRALARICEQEEQDRFRALEAMLMGGQKIHNLRGIGVTKDYPPELKLTENSRLQLYASVFPFPRPTHPHVDDILSQQLKAVIRHFQAAASVYGASEVTHLRYVPTPEDATGVVKPGPRMGKISAMIVQQVQETPSGPIKTPPMDASKPCKEYAKYTLPEQIVSPAIVYEVLVERSNSQ